MAWSLGLGVSSGIQADYYDLLGIKLDANASEVKKAYRELARETHPDTSIDGQHGSQAFVELNEAYQTLIDSDLRNQYDKSRCQLGLWMEQVDSPQKHRRSVRYLYQLGGLLVFLVFVAYVSDLIFQQNAITDDPYTVTQKDVTKSKDMETPHHGEIETQSKQRSVVNKPDVSLSSEKGIKTQEALFSPYKKNDWSSHPELIEASIKKKEASLFSETKIPGGNKEDTIKGKLESMIGSPESTIVKHQGLQSGSVPESKSRLLHKILSSSESVEQIRSLKTDSKQLDPQNVHVIIEATVKSDLIDNQKAMQAILPKLDSHNIIADSAKTEKQAESREKQLEYLAELKESIRQKRQKSELQYSGFKASSETLSSESVKQVLASGAHSEQLAQEDVHVIRKDTRPPSDNLQNVLVVLEELASNDVIFKSAKKEKQADSRKKQLKYLAELKESERKEELDVRIKAFLRRYCREYENKDLARFARFFAPDAVERGKPFSKLLPKYKKNFQTIDAIHYHIKLKKYSNEANTGNIEVWGNFLLQWRMNDGPFKESAGDIYMALYENGDSILVKKLDYHFKR
ncbi:MAG: J domain-containing protein [Thermodesulfobacteriota bacterium]|nr:J domain-containing protein [Thermodesulfobacteriota bacterium]